MALIVEDGTGLETAESYASVAEATAYFAKFGSQADWTGATEGQQEVALRNATLYLDTTYGRRWDGVRVYEVQALDWPREGIEDNDGYEIADDEVPVALKNATAEMALRYLQDGDLLPDDDSGGNVVRERVKAGPVERDTEYAGVKDQTKNYKKVEGLLESACLIHSSTELRRA